MPAVDGRQYLVGDFLIDTARYRISSVGAAVPVEPKVFDLLVYLIRHRDRVVTREELFEKVWDGRPVSDATLSNHVKSARKVLGDSGELQQTIQTVRGRGYQFVAPVNEVAAGPGDATDGQAPAPATAPARRSGRPAWLLPLAAVLVLAAAALFWWPRPDTAAAPVNSQKSWLLVVPLDVYGPEPESSRLWANDLTRRLVTSLRGITGLKTKERATTFEFEQKKTHAYIEEKLPDVRYVLGGRMDFSADRQPVVIMELDDLVTQEQLWTERYAYPPYAEDEGFQQLQTIITRAVTSSLQVTILEDEKRALQRLGQPRTNNKEAKNLYLQGWKHLLLPTHESLNEAVDLFGKATRLDAGFYDAHLAMGKALRLIYGYYDTPSDVFDRVVQAFEKAQALRKDAAEPLSELGLTYAMAWKWEKAWEYLDAARQKGNLATTELGFALYYSGLNQGHLVKRSLRLAEEIDSLNVEIADWGNWALFLVGETAASRAWAGRMMERHPTVGFIFTDAAIGAYLDKDYKRAIKYAQDGLTLEESPLALIIAAQAFGYAGETDKVRPLLERAVRSESYVCPYESAIGYISIKDYDKAMELLEDAFRKLSNCLVFLRVDPRLQPIRDHPRHGVQYRDLLRRVGLHDEKFYSYPLCRGPDGQPGRDCGGPSPEAAPPRD